MRFRLATAAPPVLAAAFLMLVVAASGGCEAIVSGKIAAFQDITTTDASQPPPSPDGQVEGCTGTDPNACPAGQYCLGAGCTACDTRDVCDGYDNDCNGKVDDGPLSDHDGDGYSFCGHIDTSSGKLIDVDCDDDDPAIHPTALEICNGKDDDCDGVIDNAELVCAASQTCVPKTGQCISDTQACTTANCPAPQVCDPSTQKCVTQNGGLGTPCSGDKACTSGICGDTAVLGSIGGVCTKPCCTSQDCDAGFVCYGPGTGGDYCVKAASVGRTLASGGGGGAGTGGAPCGAGTDCRSGLCSGNKCFDTCCNDGNCAAGTACGVSSVSGKTSLACVPPPGSVDPNATCNSDRDCRSGVCAEYTDGNQIYKRCAAGCCSSTTCGAFTVNGAFGTQIQVPTTCFDDQLSGGTVPLCDQPKQGNGDGNVGDQCRSNGDCLSDRCGNDHFCTDSCCVDADCGKTGWVCRPQQVGTGTYLRCVQGP